MKKTIIFATTIAIILSFAGCGTRATKETVAETTIVTTTATEPIGAPTETMTETTEPVETTAEETIGEFYWPTFGIVERLPKVDWTTRGQIYVDSPDSFYCDIYDTDLKIFGDYVSACQELGYVNEYYNIPGSAYYGIDDDGYTLTVAYYKDDNRMSISLYNYPET